MTDHRTLREALGGYVLGALEPEERRRLDEHLVSCSECRDELSRLSAMPALLSRLTADEVRDATLVPPDSLATAVSSAATAVAGRLQRQLRAWRAVSAVAAAACVVLVLAWAPWDGPDLDRWEFEPAATVADTRGTAAALAWDWGTTVELRLSDLPAADRYVVWAVAEDGRREQAGTWGRTASGDAWVRGASAIQRSELERIEVTTVDGPVVVAFDVEPPAR